MIRALRFFFEKYGFQVCNRIADRFGIKTTNVRLSFIYVSFFTIGAGFVLYLIIAFWLKIKDIIFTKRSSVFDL